MSGNTGAGPQGSPVFYSNNCQSKHTITITSRFYGQQHLIFYKGRIVLGTVWDLLISLARGIQGEAIFPRMPSLQVHCRVSGKENSVPNTFQCLHLDQYSLEQPEVRMGPELSPKSHHHRPPRLSTGAIVLSFTEKCQRQGESEEQPGTHRKPSCFRVLSADFAMRPRVRLSRREACVRAPSIRLWTLHCLHAVTLFLGAPE